MATVPLSAAQRPSTSVWRSAPHALAGFAVSGLLIAVAFHHGLVDLTRVWDIRPEYSYGYAIPPVAAYLLWQRRGEFARFGAEGSWAGTALVALGLVGLLIGEIATLGTVVQYSLLVVIAGVVLAYLGAAGFRAFAAPLAVLLFMVPLPNYLVIELSQWLQLVSTKLGVSLIRAFGVSVYMEGNVIDLGALKLQVVEACNGLRYLFPLTALAFICALLYRAPLRKRALVVASAVPITVLMNSLRIGLIGVMVEYQGREAAEGVLHDFEGWIIFMVCTALLVLEMWLLAGRRPLADLFAPDAAEPPAGAIRLRDTPRSYVAANALLALAALAAVLAPARAHVAPARVPFAEFPLGLEAWQGRRDRLDPDIVQALQLDDYLLADFSRSDAPGELPVNLYAAYYLSQANGVSSHSPRACIPGDGWEIEDFENRELALAAAGAPLRVNRVVIRKGERRQLVYYWFQQRGRFMTGEYTVKLQILRDALLHHRTDGAMVRVIARLRPGEPVEAGDRRLEDFVRVLLPRLAPHIPE
jgi:exosortase D (VPLPA-CTERM-specific)